MRSEARVAIGAVFDAMPAGIAVVDRSMSIRMQNEAAQSLGAAALVSAPCAHLAAYHLDGMTPFLPSELPVFRATAMDTVEVWIRSPACPDGCFVEVTCRPLELPDENELSMLVMRDCTESRRRVYMDPLTGAHNRRSLAILAAYQRKLAVRDSGHMSLAFVDIDGLKDANDTHGHAVGDALIMGTAEVLTEAVRKSDVVARVGGDEFCVLLRGQEPLSVLDMKARMARSLGAFNGRSELPTSLSLSIGVATRNASDPGCTLGNLMSEADAAMYRRRRWTRRLTA